MKILLVKTSSLGDVVHALPAVTEASNRVENVSFVWVVEESLSAIPGLHPAVSQVIPVAVRRWRKSWWGARDEIRRFSDQVKALDIDLVLDSQGLIKSALLARMAGRSIAGFNSVSAREGMASWFYQQVHNVPQNQHAVLRQKELFAGALGYRANESIDYGLHGRFERQSGKIMLMHGTTWSSKEWPEASWKKLAGLCNDAGYEVLLPAGNHVEFNRAQRITHGLSATILDRLPLETVIENLKRCSGVVSVDTGLGHLAVALKIPTLGLFGATDPGLTGFMGATVEQIVSNHLPCIPCRKRDCKFRRADDSSNIYPPCFENTTPETVWQALYQSIKTSSMKAQISP
jgi:heptosyltransferase I